jgi:Uma2 family endonuclease
VRRQARQGEERRAALAERHRLLAVVERRQLAEAVHPGRAVPQRARAHRGGDALQVVARGQHLAAALADGEQPLGVVTVATDGALDVGEEAHGPEYSPGGPARSVYPIRDGDCSHRPRYNPIPEATMGARLRRRRFTVDEYHRMGETGILPEDGRIELITGDIIVREPVGTRHAGTVDRLNRLWTSRLGERAIVRIQNPVQFRQEDTELQPDVMLLRPREDFYSTAHPVAADVLLLLEVADTTLRLDRRVKIALYARVGVAEVWLVDLTTDRVERYHAPHGDRYRDATVAARGQRLTPLAFPDVTVTVEDLIG